MNKPNDIIIRYTVYGFLIGIIFPFASLLLHSLTGNTSFTLHGFGYLHKLFPGQFLLDVLPVLTTVAGVIAGTAGSTPVQCSDCHGPTDHPAAHNFARATEASCLASGCHVDNVVTEHVDNRGLTCFACHESVDPNVQDAITHMEQAGEATRERSRKNAFLTLSLSAAAILLGIGFSVLMARRITRPVATLMALAALVTGRGSESGEEEKKDEIAALAGAMGRMAGSHQQMLLRLGEYADSLEAAASGLSTTCRTLDDLAGETKTDLPDREKSVREIGELGDLLRQLNDDLADTTEGLRKLLDRYEEW